MPLQMLWILQIIIDREMLSRPYIFSNSINRIYLFGLQLGHGIPGFRRTKTLPEYHSSCSPGDFF